MATISLEYLKFSMGAPGSYRKTRDYGEERYNVVVEFRGRIVNIAFTPHLGKVRPISVRDASKKERAVFHAEADIG